MVTYLLAFSLATFILWEATIFDIHKNYSFLRKQIEKTTAGQLSQTQKNCSVGKQRSATGQTETKRPNVADYVSSQRCCHIEC